MQQKFLNYLFSNKLTAFLFIAFPVAMAVGTFLESFYSTTAAKIWIYNAWWFELIMFLLMINFVGNIVKYRLFNKDKWATLLIHLSLILIILGAFITRYFGYEGVLSIREGNQTNQIISEKTYLTVLVDGEIGGSIKRKKLSSEVLFSEHTRNNLNWNQSFDNKRFNISYFNYIENAVEGLILDPEGDRYLKVVEASDGNRNEHFIKEGEVSNIKNILFTLNNPIEGAINIRSEQGLYYISLPFSGTYTRMSDQFSGKVDKVIDQELQLRSLYSIPNFQFVIPDPPLRGDIGIIKSDDEQIKKQDALFLSIDSQGESKQISIMGGKGIVNDPISLQVGGLDFYISYGSKLIDLPFSIKLNDFIAKKYPGTEKSYSSFKSKVSVIDNSNTFDYDIYMNNILDYKGFRFFQASFDPDEKGTVLSVNHDSFGTLVTYIGYILLYVSMCGIFFIGRTRFKTLSKSLSKLNQNVQSLFFVFMFFGYGNAQVSDLSSKTQIIDFDSLVKVSAFPDEQANKFGSLVIQDLGGRMKPANTFSSELLRKVSKKDNFNGLSSDQVLLSITNNPSVWYNVPIIYLKRGNDSIRKIAGLKKNDKYAPLVSFFDKNGNYKISNQLETAYRTQTPNQFQKDFIELDRRINLLYSALEGKILRIFPVPNDSLNKWVSFPEIDQVNFIGNDSLYVKNVLPLYFQALRLGKINGDFSQSDELIESLKGFQNKYGAGVLPTKSKINAEILYNKYDIFKRLFSYYLYSGILLFIVLIVQIFKQRQYLVILKNILIGLIVSLFTLHTLGLLFRAFISGHAPWSDAYESMIYVAWATLFFGLVFGRKSSLTISATTFVSSMILMIAHWNWMDPSIANLQPVLNSYWLMIHVAVIVASYGPFSISLILGIISLLLIILINKKNKIRVKARINELTIVNELSITIGLIMLTIGNFLGGMWANESWGRYWGWDPKETWALISIMVYAFVIHMRLVPGLRGKWLFNLMSIIAYSSILMTYFGVNFYLVGLHSYASGDKIITPNFVYYSIIFVILLGSISRYYYKKNYN
ncbi:MAG: cytochrome C biogenesis protein [Flavobacteriaceae bacterium]|nr:cytochrome C biogenesis protein [Flavobacteriaceae bacterium]|tara:strand:- start:7068 stop:10196 length:3129 start_codon:yes stop_codon:yes gene_type:complete